MNQQDFVGGLPPAPPFKDIRNTRSRAAEEKAELCLTLNRLCKSPPPCVLGGSIQKVREWTAAAQIGLKLVGNSRASIPQLSAATANMRRFL